MSSLLGKKRQQLEKNKKPKIKEFYSYDSKVVQDFVKLKFDGIQKHIKTLSHKRLMKLLAMAHHKRCFKFLHSGSMQKILIKKNIDKVFQKVFKVKHFKTFSAGLKIKTSYSTTDDYYVFTIVDLISDEVEILKYVLKNNIEDLTSKTIVKRPKRKRKAVFYNDEVSDSYDNDSYDDDDEEEQPSKKQRLLDDPEIFRSAEILTRMSNTPPESPNVNSGLISPILGRIQSPSQLDTPNISIPENFQASMNVSPTTAQEDDETSDNGVTDMDIEDETLVDESTHVEQFTPPPQPQPVQPTPLPPTQPVQPSPQPVQPPPRLIQPLPQFQPSPMYSQTQSVQPQSVNTRERFDHWVDEDNNDTQYYINCVRDLMCEKYGKEVNFSRRFLFSLNMNQDTTVFFKSSSFVILHSFLDYFDDIDLHSMLEILPRLGFTIINVVENSCTIVTHPDINKPNNIINIYKLLSYLECAIL